MQFAAYEQVPHSVFEELTARDGESEARKRA
jgi:hypothetical protein